MKKQLIRNNVFETNSSSSHSISIADNTKEFTLETIYPDQDGIVIVEGGEFGWEWEKYNDAQTKASYCAVYSQNNPDKRKMLIEVIKEQTGAEMVNVSDEGYIDHDSDGVASDAFVSKDTLKNFIFNKNSWLFTGNDNSTPDPTFYHVPEFKDGKKIVPRYKFELKIDGYNKTTKFLSEPTEDDINDALQSLLQSVYLHENGYFDDDNSVMAQINRDTRKLYEFRTWKTPIDFENKLAKFTRDAYNDAYMLWEKDHPKSGNIEEDDKRWRSEEGYSLVRKIEDKLLTEENSKYVKSVKYEIISI